MVLFVMNYSILVLLKSYDFCRWLSNYRFLQCFFYKSNVKVIVANAPSPARTLGFIWVLVFGTQNETKKLSFRNPKFQIILGSEAEFKQLILHPLNLSEMWENKIHSYQPFGLKSLNILFFKSWKESKNNTLACNMLSYSITAKSS